MFSKLYGGGKPLKAFTLAEVLVTLAIIGVVAALTIPTLIQSYDERQAVSKVKKYTSVLNSAVKMYAVENNCIGNLAACGAFVTPTSTGTGYQMVWNALKPYLNVVKDCNNDTSQGCWAPGVTYKLINGKDHEAIDDRTYGKGILADGVSIYVTDGGGNCSHDRSIKNEGPLFHACGGIVIDINGHKSPNKYGRDVFFWLITNNGMVYPGGTEDMQTCWGSEAGGYCDPTYTGGGYDSPGGGKGCAAKILDENAVNY